MNRKSDYNDVSPEGLDVTQFRVVDVREPAERFANLGFIPTSENVPLGEILSDVGLANVNPDTKLLMVCRSGGRSSDASKHLASKGYTNVSNLLGGMLKWNELELVKVTINPRESKEFVSAVEARDAVLTCFVDSVLKHQREISESKTEIIAPKDVETQFKEAWRLANAPEKLEEGEPKSTFENPTKQSLQRLILRLGESVKDTHDLEEIAKNTQEFLSLCEAVVPEKDDDVEKESKKENIHDALKPTQMGKPIKGVAQLDFDDIVETPYGKGQVKECRNGMYKVELIDGIAKNTFLYSVDPTASLNLSAALPAAPLEPKIGEIVGTPYGKGELVSYRESDSMYQVSMANWGSTLYTQRISRVYDQNFQVENSRARTISRVLGMMFHSEHHSASLIVGCLYVEGQLDVHSVRDLCFTQLVEKYPRFRSVVGRCEKKKKMSFLGQTEVDLEYHVREPFDSSVRLSQKEIHEYIGALYNEGLDGSKPLWRCNLLRDENGRTLLAFEIDHVIGDGQGLVSVLMNALLDDDPFEASGKQQLKSKGKRPTLPLHRKVAVFSNGVMRGLLSPSLPMDKPNPLKSKTVMGSPYRLTTVTPKVALERLNEIRRCFAEHVTVNDVVLAAITLTLKAYYAEIGETKIVAGKQRVRGGFPIDLRGRSKSAKKDDIGNQWSMGMFRFPFQCNSYVDLIHRISKNTNEIKNSPEPLISMWMGRNVVSMLPEAKQIEISVKIALKATATISNVMGPSKKAKVLGRTLDDLAFQLMSPAGVYFGVISYAGYFSGCLSCDPECCPDPNLIAKHFVPQFEMMYDSVMNSYRANNNELIVRSTACFPSSAKKSNNAYAKLE